MQRHQHALRLLFRRHDLLAPRAGPAFAAGGKVLDHVVEVIAKFLDFLAGEDALQTQEPVLVVEVHLVWGEAAQLRLRPAQCGGHRFASFRP